MPDLTTKDAMLERMVAATDGLADKFGEYLPLAGGTMTGAIEGNPLTLTADDGDSSADLVLNPNGSATWNSKEIERVNANGTDYIRFESGLQICWGQKQSISTTGVSVSFPVPFYSQPRLGITGTASTLLTSGTDETGFTAKTSSGSATIAYIAVGYWK